MDVDDIDSYGGSNSTESEEDKDENDNGGEHF